MAQILVVVSRTEPTRYAYLAHVFANDIVNVIVDRRLAPRRHRQEPVARDRRRVDRRQRDVGKDLETSGWALVRP